MTSKNLPLTCKYFFTKANIVFFETDMFYSNNILSYYNPHSKYTQVPTDKVQYWLNKVLDASKNSMNLCRIFYRCDLYKVNISEQNLSLCEINILLSSQKTIALTLTKVNICDKFGAPVSIDVILSKVPNVNYLILQNKCEIVNQQTFTNLNKIKFNQKFKLFSWKFYEISIGPTNFLPLVDFVKKNAENGSHFDISGDFFQENELSDAVVDMLKAWAPSEIQPRVDIHGFGSQRIIAPIQMVQPASIRAQARSRPGLGRGLVFGEIRKKSQR